VNLRSASGTVLIGTVALLLIAVLGWLLLISPTTGKISETHDANDAAVDSNQVLTGQVAALKRQAEELPRIRQVAGTLKQIFPATADQPGFFAAINKAASGAGIPLDKVTTLSPTAPAVLDATGAPATSAAASAAPAADTAEQADTAGAADTPPAVDLAVQTVAVTVEGSYEEIRRLLANLEAMPRAFVISSLSVTGGSDSSSSGEGATPSASTLTVSITGSTFVAPPIAYPELKSGGSSKSTG
jgi:Tfp pilus assembly protein PilO